MKQPSIIICLITALVFLTCSNIAIAQLEGDPAAMPVPDFTIPDPGRALAVTVKFNSPTDIVIQDIIVSNTPAMGTASNPPLILLELYNSDGQLVGIQNDWSPLWERNIEEDGTESQRITESAEGTFFMPFSSDLAEVKIKDQYNDLPLTTVDVSVVVNDYCVDNPNAQVCGGDGEPGPTPTPTPTPVVDGETASNICDKRDTFVKNVKSIRKKIRNFKLGKKNRQRRKNVNVALMAISEVVSSDIDIAASNSILVERARKSLKRTFRIGRKGNSVLRRFSKTQKRSMKILRRLRAGVFVAC